MTLNRFWVLLFSTLVLGIVTGFVNALFGWFGSLSPYFGLELGGFVSATAMMGFWGYLMLNFTAHSFLHPRLWSWVQLVFLILVFFDTVYLRRISFGGGNAAWAPYIGYAVVPLIWAILIAMIKVKITNSRAFIPTLFFMYVFSILEWYVALKANLPGITEAVGFVLLVCNAWLILILGKILEKQKVAPTS